MRLRSQKLSGRTRPDWIEFRPSEKHIPTHEEIFALNQYFVPVTCPPNAVVIAAVFAIATHYQHRKLPGLNPRPGGVPPTRCEAIPLQPT